MKLFKRHILTILALVLYWPIIFTLTHIPVPASLIRINVSDKSLHFIAYFVLVFLLWSVINPNSKVNWRKPAAWWILFIVICYGALDEWLQGYVNRSPDIKDFLADLCGAAVALGLLTIFNFWTMSLMVTGSALFIFANLLRANTNDLSTLPLMVFHLLGYFLFTILWIRWIHYFLPVKPLQSKWLIAVLVMPLGFLILTELFLLIITRNFSIVSAVLSVVGAITAVLAVYLIPLIQRQIS